MKHVKSLALALSILGTTCGTTSLAHADAVAECDALAASPEDVTRPKNVPGVASGAMKAEEAVKACEAARLANPDDARISFELARALDVAKKDLPRVFQLYSSRA